MSDGLTLKICQGEGPYKINEFYRKNGSIAQARHDDLFFLLLTNKKINADQNKTITADHSQILGCVRFCIEESTAMLRTMMIDSSCRKSGLGSKLLQAFEEHLRKNRIQQTYCIPYAHLEKFYSQIGVKNLAHSAIPLFLQDRLAYYRKTFPNNQYLCMGRFED